MPKILKEDWKSALTFILQELKTEQYSMLLERLSKVPQGRRTDKSREEMPQIIIERYEEEESISEIKEAMEQIPRRDSAVQDLLRPFVGKRKNKHEKEKKEMSNISERKWKTALTSILEELDESEYKKMVLCCFFDKIPKHAKTGRSREEMPQIIIQHLGLDESISAINEAMEQLPRRDSAVQDKLRPFVDKLRNKREEENKGFKRNDAVSDSDSADEEQKVAADQLKSSQPDKTIEQKWKTSLTSILEELDESEYKKMLLNLDKIPKGLKTVRSREEMPQTIIQHYGVEQSVLAIKKVMDLIPRKDAAVQDWLCPFVDQLKKHQTKNKVEETHGQSSKPGSSGNKHFVDKHRVELIQRVTNIGPILDELLGDVIQTETYDKIRALSTTQDKMRALYDGPLRAGKESKEVFYKLLKKNEKYLIRELDEK